MLRRFAAARSSRSPSCAGVPLPRRAVASLLAIAVASPLAAARAETKETGGRSDAHALKARTVREELSEAARRDWDAARDLLDANDYSGALVEYLRAFEVSKNPRVLFNVGVCEKSLKHYARAVARFKQELSLGAGKLSAQETADVKDAIAALEPFVSTVTIVSSEAGATLTIDGDESGVTPFTSPVPIDVGAHTLKLHKDGFAEATQAVTIAGGAPAKANFVMDPLVKRAPVTVAVQGAPGATASATVVIDGVDMGQTPFQGELAAGRHTFEARAEGFVTARQTLEVVYKTPLAVTLDLSVERHEGKLRVEAAPASAAIEIDGVVVGSGTWEGALKAGGHQLIVRRPGYVSYTQEISLTDGQQRSVKATLPEEKGADKSWIAWTIGTVVVVGGGVVAGYFLFKPTDEKPIVGTFDPGTVTTSHFRFGHF